MLSITQRQKNLRYYYYYYKGNIDGIEGVQLKSAYTNFQRDNGLEVDGIYGVKTENKLIQCIKNTQIALNNNGYNLVADGMVGNDTINATKNYQLQHGLTPDGIAGKLFFNSIENDKQYSWDDVIYFKKSEFDCPCGCGKNNINLRLVKVLDMIRAYYNSPIIITCGCRCQKFNDSLKGSIKGSKHISGNAADFYVKGISANTLLNYCKELQRQGIIEYTYTNNSNMNGAVHIQI